MIDLRKNIRHRVKHVLLSGDSLVEDFLFSETTSWLEVELNSETVVNVVPNNTVRNTQQIIAGAFLEFLLKQKALQI